MKKFGVVFLWISLLFSATYYVSPSGDNSNSGSYDHPWRDPGFASKQISSGDTLVILSGTYDMHVYYDDMITPPAGTLGRATVIMGSGTTTPVLRGDGSLLACIDISGLSYVVLKNLEITSIIDTPYSGGVREGIEAGGSGGGAISNVVFEDIYIHHVEEAGIAVSGDAEYISFKNVRIERTGGYGLGGPGGNSGGWRHVTIDSSYFGYCGHFYQGRDTLSEWDRPDGFGIEDSEGPVEIRYTVSEHNNGDGLDSKSKNTYIHHCIVANNFGDGIKLWGDSSRVENTLIYGTGDGRQDTTPWCLLVIDTDDGNGYFEILNVTMWDSPDRPPHYAGTVQYDNETVPITLVMKNVIISGQRRFFVRPSVSLIAENNLFYINEDVQIYANGTEYTSSSIGSLGSGNIYGDPLFLNPLWGETGDFHLNESSPCIDAGVVIPDITDDLDLVTRPQGAGFDIGAYEWHTGDIKEGRRFENKGIIDLRNLDNVLVRDISGRKIRGKLRTGVYFVPMGDNRQRTYRKVLYIGK